MEADFSVELGADDESLEFPWTDPGEKLRYYDIKRQPELLLSLEEARRYPELGEFLAEVNSPASEMESAKCDAWFTRELQSEDEIFQARAKLGSYVDLLFSETARRCSFPGHEKFARGLTAWLKQAPEIPAMAEFIIRRCYYPPSQQGFYFTLYLFGYGDDEIQSRRHWAMALKLVENALRQVPGGVQSR